jgi:GT2 family glycosyltransferase/SAM-dependent methyltransferase/glycosyltransferase involved in cell wall biosynthesis
MADDHTLPLIVPTGERFARTPSEAEVELEHVHRYRAASALCVGKRVLDAASGEGYGTAILVSTGADVVGIEIDPDTVAAARLRYPGLDFREGDVASLPLPDREFDYVTSFETLEHIPNPQASLDEFRRVLKPNGVLIISTPDKVIYNRHLAEPNPYHVHEMGREEFRVALLRRFKNVALYGQRVVFGSLLISPLGGRLDTARRTPDGSIAAQNGFDSAMYLIAVCSDGPLPELPQGLYEGGVPQNALSSLLGGIEERDRELRTLRESVAAAPDAAAAEAAAALARDARAAEQALAGARAEAAESLRRLRRAEAESAAASRDIREKTDQVAALSAQRRDLTKSLRDARLAAQTHEQAAEAQAEALAALQADVAITPKGFVRRMRTWVGDALLAAGRHRRAPRATLRAFLSLRAIRRSGLVSETYYKRTRSDLRHEDAVRHYFLFGVSERTDPSPLFSTEGYLAAHPEVGQQGYNPLAHYVRFGRRQGWPIVAATPARALAPSQAPTLGPGLSAPPPAISAAPAPRDERVRHAWKVAEDPMGAPDRLAAYDVRPDDEVPREALRGAHFTEQHRLLSDEPDIEGAVRALNRRARLTVAEDAAAPDVSIVAPVHGQLAYTLNCLDALLAHTSRYSFEVIVVDDASPDASGDVLPRVNGIRYRRQDRNGGFIASSNAGAELGRGAALVMLNNDTRVVEGWLDELVGTLRSSPRIGLVGSKLFYPDGSLQEAGGIIWRDGSAWNYGRNDDPNRPEYSYARPVDYVSGASIAVRADLWRTLGGFDSHFSPAYCEDSDLAFRVRQAGFETWMQPLSRVIHYEGKSSGTDTSQGVKAYQVVNSEKLFERWKPSLTLHRPSGEQPWLERDRGASKRVLVLDESIPTPDQDAGSVTTVKVIQVFQDLGYKVVFAPADNFLFQRKYTEDLQRLGVECLYAPFNVDLESHLREHGTDYDVVHIFRHGVMRQAVDMVREHCPQAIVMFNNMDLHYLRMLRQAQVEGFGETQALATKSLELETMDQADLIFVPSTYERDLLRAEALAPPVQVMPFMVDEVTPVVPPAEASDVMFLGGFRHPPNVDAVLWFHAEVWPAIAAACPAARFLIVGAHPPEEILALQSERVVVTGRVEHLEPIFAGVRAFVAPLRYGAGVKGKIYTAMAYGAPVITTTVGAEGMDLRPDLDALVADQPSDIVASVVRVFRDGALERRLREAGPAFVADRATLKAGSAAMTAALALLQRTPRPSGG